MQENKRVFIDIIQTLPKHWGRLAAITTATFLGTACDNFEGNPLAKQPPQNPESAVVTPSVQPNPTQFDSPLVLAVAHQSPTQTETVQSPQTTFLPSVERADQTAEVEPQKVILFSGAPNSLEGQQIGDGGFRTKCNFGKTECGRDEKIISGPYLRNFDQPQMKELGLDDSTLEITVEGTGFAKVGATDAKMTSSSFGFYEANVQLPHTFRIYWPGLQETDNGGFNGYGLEVTAEKIIDLPQPQAHITNIIIEKIGDGNLLGE